MTRTVAGVDVSQSSANGVSAYWNGVCVISGNIGVLDRHLYRRGGSDDERERAVSHPVYKLIHGTPNPYMTPQVFWETITSHAVSWGNGYAEIEWDNALRPIALWPIMPNVIEPVVETISYSRGRKASKLWYRYRGSERIEPEDLLHIHGLGFDGLQGYSPVYLARQSLGLTLAAERFGAALFGNHAIPGLALQHPKELSKSAHERLNKSLDLRYSREGAHGTIILEEGMTISKSLTIPPDDAQFLECVAPETEVALADGTRKRADAVVVGDRVFGWDAAAGRLIPSRIECVRDNGVHDVLTIRTHRGREITVTTNHQFLAARRARCRRCGRSHAADPAMTAGWIRAESLTVGDYVATLDGVAWEGTNEVDAERAYLVGAMLGDGSIRERRGALGFTNADVEVLEAVGAAAAPFGATLRSRSRYNYEFGGGAKIGRPRAGESMEATNPLRAFFGGLGLLGTDSYSKFIPQAIFRSGEAQARAVLAGLFDTDGSVRKPGDPQPMAYICTTSKRLALDAQHGLALLGVQAAVRTQTSKLERVAIRYEVTVCGRENIARLSSLPLRHAKKAARLATWALEGGAKERDAFRRMDRIVEIRAEAPRSTVAITVEGTHSHVTAGLVSHNTRSFQIEEIARWLNLPPHKLKHKVGQRPGGNIEASQIDFLTDSLLPWAERIEQECEKKLISPAQRGAYYVEHEFKKILRTDVATRTETQRAYFDMGVVTAEQIAKQENLPKPETKPESLSVKEKVEAAKELVNAGFDPVETLQALGLPPIKHEGREEPEPPPAPPVPLVEKPPPPADDQGARAGSALRVLIQDRLQQYVRRESGRLRQAAKKDAAGLEAWVKEFYKRELMVLADVLVPLVRSGRAIVGLWGDVPGVARRLARDHVERSMGEVLSLPAQDIAFGVEALAKRWETTRAGELATALLDAAADPAPEVDEPGEPAPAPPPYSLTFHAHNYVTERNETHEHRIEVTPAPPTPIEVKSEVHNHVAPTPIHIENRIPPAPAPAVEVKNEFRVPDEQKIRIIECPTTRTKVMKRDGKGISETETKQVK